MDQPTLINALLHIHHSTPTTISTPTTPLPSTPSSSNQKRNNNHHRRASVAIIIRIAPLDPQSTQSSPTNSPSSSPKYEPQSIHQQPSSLHPNSSSDTQHDLSQQLHQFFSQEWVQNGTPELLFIERATRTSDRWSAHLAFPGGRMEPEDEDGLFCAMRETWEEVGIDLAEKEFIPLGRLDDREITTSLGKRLLMVLSPYVFLSTHPTGGPIPTLEPTEVSAAYWVPIHYLAGPQTKWGEMTIDLSTRLAPSRGPLISFILRSLVGSMRFRSILLPHNPIVEINRAPSKPEDDHHHPSPDLNLWGLTLGMTLDLLSFFKTPNSSLPDQPNLYRSPSLEHLNVPPREITLVTPSITSIFPRFTHPDINALIWLLGRRYRNLIKQCHQQQEQTGLITGRSRSDLGEEGAESDQERVMRGKVANNQKMTINYMNNQMSWTSLAMKEFYRSVRKALILSVLFRILSVSATLATLSFLWGPNALNSSRLLLNSLRSRLETFRRYHSNLFYRFLKPSSS